MNTNLTAPGQKNLTALQAKLHYLKIISELPSYGAKCFSTTLSVSISYQRNQSRTRIFCSLHNIRFESNEIEWQKSKLFVIDLYLRFLHCLKVTKKHSISWNCVYKMLHSFWRDFKPKFVLWKSIFRHNSSLEKLIFCLILICITDFLQNYTLKNWDNHEKNHQATQIFSVKTL